MPTLVSYGDSRPHQHRPVAQSFGADAARYDRTRPRYPGALIDALAGPGLAVLDVGTGTGIAARQLQAAGCTVLGVEPDERMAAFARQHGTDVEVNTFEDVDPAGRFFDVVVAAQAWHWVDPVAGAAQAARLLRPGGRIAVFWNVDQLPDALAQDFAAVYRHVVPDSPVAGRWAANGPDPYAPLCDLAADGIRQAGAFEEPQRWRFDWRHTYTRQQWLDVLPTQGGFSLMRPDEQQRVLAGTGAAVDAYGGSFTVEAATVVVTALRAALTRHPVA